MGNFINAISSINIYKQLIASRAIILKGELEYNLQRFLLDPEMDIESIDIKSVECIEMLYNNVSEKKLNYTSLLVRKNDMIREAILSGYHNILKFLNRLPLYFEREGYIFVHGAINSGLMDWRKTSEKTFVTGCQSILGNLSDKTVVSSVSSKSRASIFKRAYKPIIIRNGMIILNSQNGVSEVTVDV